MIYPIPMGSPSVVFSSMGQGRPFKGMCTWSTVLRSMKFPADPESISTETTEKVSEDSITAEILHNERGIKGEAVTTGVFLLKRTPVLVRYDPDLCPSLHCQIR